jgi:hypothetical protein
MAQMLAMTLQSPLARSALAGIAGFLVYGGWAAFANSEHGPAISMRSGFVQGSYSLVLTFAMTMVTEWLFDRFSHGTTLPASIRIAALMAIICSGLFSTAYAIHMLVGTPEILMTILPGFLIGSVYTFIYILGLQSGNRV